MKTRTALDGSIGSVGARSVGARSVRAARWLSLGLVGALAGCFFRSEQAPPPVQPGAAACTSIGSAAAAIVPAGVTVTSARYLEAGNLPPHPMLRPPGQPMGPALPAHCVVNAAMEKRVGVDGKPYEIHFELRLPTQWNGRFFYQGGGGNDGVVNLALGRNTGSLADYGSGLARGFAVVTTDAGHQSPGPEFGLDPRARVNNAYAAHEKVAVTAKAIIGRYFGKGPQKSYYMGCSGGGRQGMMFTQRYPDYFDGVVVVAPAMSVSSGATIAAAWDTQQYMAIAPTDAAGNRLLSQAFSNQDLDLVAAGILKACDAQDGLADGMVNNVRACRFDPAVLQCQGAKTAACLSAGQVGALAKAFAGPKDSGGKPLYVGQPWDPGIAAPGWRAWKLGNSTTGTPDANNTRLMAGALAYYFVTPPDPELKITAFNFDRDPSRMLTHSLMFDTYRNTTLAEFRKHDGKLMIVHGVADGIFSASESIDYLERLGKEHGGLAAVQAWARLFLVPGMNHCLGGLATDRFDSLEAIVNWVEKGEAPERMVATAAPDHPRFANRSRPLCPYPKYARFTGTGNPEDAGSFVCQ